MGSAGWQPPDVVTSGRIGVRVSVALVVILVVDLLVRAIVPGPVAVVALVVVAAGSVVGRRVDWGALAERPVGTWGPYVWTSVGLVAWAVYVGAVGGGAPDRLVLVLAVAIIAIAVGYPPRGQFAMYGVTILSLVAGRVWAGSPMLAATLLLDVGLLLVLSLVAATASLHLRRARRTAARTRASAERRSELIHAVASLSRLDPQEAMDTAVGALVDLGFDAAAVIELEDGFLRSRAQQGLPADRPPDGLVEPDGIAHRSLSVRETVILEDHAGAPIPLSAGEHVGSIVAAPVVVDGDPGGVVLGLRRSRGRIPSLQVEVLETIAAQAGRVLSNARRYETETETGRLLSELNHMKTELLASVSTELRSPLTMVQGLSETLQNHPELADADDELLGRLNAHADRLAAMIHDLLDFSRLQAGRYELAPTVVDLEAMVREAAHPSVAVVREGPVVAVGDERLLGRALDHLLSARQRTFVPVWVALDGNGPGGAVAVEIRMVRDPRRSESSTIGISLASEILASHGARLRVDDVGEDAVSLRFALPSPARAGGEGLVEVTT